MSLDLIDSSLSAARVAAEAQKRLEREIEQWQQDSEMQQEYRDQR